jgi:hypothetical protein
MYNFILPWILTILIEFVVIWLIIRKDTSKLLAYSILINSITLPLATYSYIYIYHNFLLTELVVMIIESLLLMLLLNIKYSKALIISITANIITGLVGYLI